MRCHIADVDIPRTSEWGEDSRWTRLTAASAYTLAPLPLQRQQYYDQTNLHSSIHMHCDQEQLTQSRALRRIRTRKDISAEAGDWDPQNCPVFLSLFDISQLEFNPAVGPRTEISTCTWYTNRVGEPVKEFEFGQLLVLERYGTALRSVIATSFLAC